MNFVVSTEVRERLMGAAVGVALARSIEGWTPAGSLDTSPAMCPEPVATGRGRRADELASHLAAHEAILQDGCKVGRERYGALPLAADAYARGVLARTLARIDPQKDAESVRQLLGRLHLADLFLACACEQDVAGAWQALMQHVLPRLRSHLCRRGLSSAEATEAIDELPGL